MIELFVELIIKHEDTIEDVPVRIRDKVREELRKRGFDENGYPLV